MKDKSMSKEDKKKARALKRDARMEKRYGIPLMRKIADNETAKGYDWISDYYFRFRAKRREGNFDLIMVAIFLLLGIFDVIICIVTNKESWGNTFGIDVILSLYWLLSFRICELESNRYLDKFIDMASIESKEQAIGVSTKENKETK